MNIVLQTERLRLRPLDESDADAMERFCTDPEVRRYLFEDRILERGAIVDIISRSVSSFAAEGFGYFGLELRDDSGPLSSGLIGFCGHRRFEDGEQVELLYGILPEHWGEGLVSEAATEALRDVFDRCHVERVIAATDTPNQRSVRVLQRLGMTFDTRREFHDLDTVFYSMTRDDVDLPVDT
jgi:ribosomal-protein-alanine N-acetyltransferase